jgi:hypothetical protein
VASLITPAQVRSALFDIKGMPQERRPSGLTDPVIEERIQRASAEVLTRLGLTTTPASSTLRRSAIDGICLDLVLIGLRRDFFGLSPEAVSALNTQESNAYRRLDALVDTSASSRGGARLRISGARPP